jgi:pyruvate kinase
VHRLVLENAEHGLGAIEQRMTRLLDLGVQHRVDHLAIGFVGELVDDIARRPPT